MHSIQSELDRVFNSNLRPTYITSPSTASLRRRRRCPGHLDPDLSGGPADRGHRDAAATAFVWLTFDRCRAEADGSSVPLTLSQITSTAGYKTTGRRTLVSDAHTRSVRIRLVIDLNSYRAGVIWTSMSTEHFEVMSTLTSATWSHTSQHQTCSFHSASTMSRGQRLLALQSDVTKLKWTDAA